MGYMSTITEIASYFLCRGHQQHKQFVSSMHISFFVQHRIYYLLFASRTTNGSVDLQNLGAGGRIRMTKASSGCPMLRKYKLQKQFRNEITQQGALDIEDLVHLGRSLNTCPYYGSRSMVPAADIVVLPYQSLLSKSSRESLGLNLKKNILIIDEAHNLADSLTSMYDSKITFSQVNKLLKLLPLIYSFVFFHLCGFDAL